MNNLENELRNELLNVLKNYDTILKTVKESEDWKNPFREIISVKLSSLFSSCANIHDPYIVKGSYGKGRWTDVPWIAVFDKRITNSAQQGVYIVYLINKDSKELFLTLNQGATEVINDTKDPGFTGVKKHLSEEEKSKLQNKAAIIRSRLSNPGFLTDNCIFTGNEGYDAGTIMYKKYSLNSMPSGESLIKDLKSLLDVYKEYYFWQIDSDTKSKVINLKDSNGVSNVILIINDNHYFKIKIEELFITH